MTTRTPTILLHGFVSHTTANGPGTRAMFWVQGCTLGCQGCFNPATHTPMVADPDKVKTPQQLMEMVPDDVQGITISGGEPFQQSIPALLQLVQLAQARGLTVVIFTGYEPWELLERPSPDVSGILSIISNTDMLISGRYERTKPSTRILLGSENQEILYPTKRYCPSDLSLVSRLEHIYSIETNTRTQTGIGTKGKVK